MNTQSLLALGLLVGWGVTMPVNAMDKEIHSARKHARRQALQRMIQETNAFNLLRDIDATNIVPGQAVPQCTAQRMARPAAPSVVNSPAPQATTTTTTTTTAQPVVMQDHTTKPSHVTPTQHIHSATVSDTFSAFCMPASGGEQHRRSSQLLALCQVMHPKLGTKSTIQYLINSDLVREISEFIPEMSIVTILYGDVTIRPHYGLHYLTIIGMENKQQIGRIAIDGWNHGRKIAIAVMPLIIELEFYSGQRRIAIVDKISLTTAQVRQLSFLQIITRPLRLVAENNDHETMDIEQKTT